MLSLAVRRRGGPRRSDLHNCPEHSATRLPPRPPEVHAEFFAVGDVIDFALVAVYGLKMVLFAPGRAAGGPRRGFLRQAQAA